MRKHPLLILVIIVLSSISLGAVFHSDPSNPIQQEKATTTYSHLIVSNTHTASDTALVSFVSTKQNRTSTSRTNRRSINERQKLAHHQLLLKRYRQYVRHKAQVQATREMTEASGVWAKLRVCESRDDYSIDTGNGYYGAYQFSLTTWQGIGKSGLPDEAPPSVQDTAARLLQEKEGWRAWPCCSEELGLN